MVALEETISMPLVVTEHGTIRIKGSRVVAPPLLAIGAVSGSLRYRFADFKISLTELLSEKSRVTTKSQLGQIGYKGQTV